MTMADVATQLPGLLVFGGLQTNEKHIFEPPAKLISAKYQDSFHEHWISVSLLLPRGLGLVNITITGQ